MRSPQLYAGGEAEQAKKSISRLAEIRIEREAAWQAKGEAGTVGVLLPLVASISLVLVRPFPPARTAESEKEKPAGRRRTRGYFHLEKPPQLRDAM